MNPKIEPASYSLDDAENIANIAYSMGIAGYAPEDSRDVASQCLCWAREFAKLWREQWDRYGDDADYIELMDAFMARKIDEVRKDCTTPERVAVRPAAGDSNPDNPDVALGTFALGTLSDLAQSFIDHWEGDDDPDERAQAAQAQQEKARAVDTLRATIARRAELEKALKGFRP